MNFHNKIYENLKCIWMSSGLVDYKLCDRNFDCDNCSYYSAMRNVSQLHNTKPNVEDSRIEKIIQKLINDLGKEELKKDCIYLNNHLMVKNLFANTYYIGFSPLANYLLDNCNLIEHCSQEEKIGKGYKIIRLHGEWGSIDIASPMNFSYLGKISNQEILQNSEKWFGLIESTKDDLGRASISGENYMKDILGVTRALTKVKIDYSEIGTTMMDGGFEVNYLYQIIGKDNYIEILKKLFNKAIN
jgi:hypothetical protein